MSSYHVGRPIAADIFRHRYQHSVNLASIFVLEQWLHPSMFDPGATGGSELDAVVSSLTVRGLDATRQKWEAHWALALTDNDLKWLTQTANCNSIRLPIGYFTLGPAFCNNTAFAMQPAEVCHGYGVGVLIAFQALPGGANAEIHSGTSTGKAEFWDDRANLDLATRCIQFIVEEVAKCSEFDSVFGVQICNEAVRQAPDMYDWYSSVTTKLAAINPTIHVYISDGWNLENALQYVKERNTLNTHGSCPLVINTHRYYNYGSTPKSLDTAAIIDEVYNELREMTGTPPNKISDGGGAAIVYVGEYCCAFPLHLSTPMPDHELNTLTTNFGQAQSRKWQEKCSGAAFFTWKIECTETTAWNFAKQVEAGAISAPTFLRLTLDEVRARAEEADRKRAQLMVTAMDEHCAHYERTGGEHQYWRFVDGWHLGWTDARAFFTSRLDRVVPNAIISGTDNEEGAGEGKRVLGADRIGNGMVDLWVIKRMAQEIEAQRTDRDFI